MVAFFCHKCGAPWESDLRQPGFKDICAGCGAYLHCCKNCRFHRPSAHNQCYIPNTEYVRDRERLNYCEEFEFRSGPPAPDGDEKKKHQARKKLDALFGDNDDDSSAPTSFDDLFKK